MSYYPVFGTMVKSFQNIGISNYRLLLVWLGLLHDVRSYLDYRLRQLCTSTLLNSNCSNIGKYLKSYDSILYLPYSHKWTTWFTPPSSTVQYPCKMECEVRRWNFSAVNVKYSFMCSGFKLYVRSSYILSSCFLDILVLMDATERGCK